MKKKIRSAFLVCLLGFSLFLTSCGADEKSTPPQDSTESKTESKESGSEVTKEAEEKTTKEKETTEEPTTEEPTTLSEEEIRMRIEDALKEASELGFCQKAADLLDTAYEEYGDERLKEAKNALMEKTVKIQTARIIEASGKTKEEVDSLIEEYSSYKEANRGLSRFEYDTRGNVYREYKYSDTYSKTVEEMVQYSHDYDGNLTEESHYVGNMTPVTRSVFEYDTEGRKTYEIQYENELIKSATEYTSTGQPSVVTEYVSGEVSSQTTYEYNEDDEEVSAIQKDASGKVVSSVEFESTYDDSGKRTGYVQKTNGNSDYKAAVTWQDDGSRLEHLEYTDGHTEDVLYDKGNHKVNTEIFDAEGKMRYFVVSEYDGDLLINELRGYKKDTPSYGWEYRYDENGDQIKRTETSYNEDGSTSFVLTRLTEYDYFNIPLPEDENEEPGKPLFSKGPDHEELVNSCPDVNAVSYVLEKNYENNWYGEKLTDLERKDYDKEEELLQTVSIKLDAENRILYAMSDKEDYDSYDKIYDDNGNPIVYAPLGSNYVYFYTYNDNNQLIEEITGNRSPEASPEPDPDVPYKLLQKAVISYDDKGNEILREFFTESDQLFRVQEKKYNKQNQITSSEDYVLDENGKRTLSLVGEYTYDKLGNLTLYRLSTTSGTVYEETKNTYDDEGNILNQTIQTSNSYEKKYYEYKYGEDGKLERKNQFMMQEDTVITEEQGGLVGFTLYEYGTFN